MGKFTNIYAVRGSEIASDYRLRNFYVSFYFQECFAEFTASKKMAAYDMEKVGLTWLISDVSIDICGELPFWRTPVKVEIWTHDINPIFLVIKFSLSANDKIFANGCARALLADANTHKAQRFGEYEKNFEKYSEENFKTNPFQKFEIQGEKIGETLQVVRVADLDFNMHLNNVRYLPRMFESMPSSIASKSTLKSFQIKYIKEALLDDKILSESFQLGETFTHRLTRISDNQIISIMKSVW